MVTLIIRLKNLMIRKDKFLFETMGENVDCVMIDNMQS